MTIGEKLQKLRKDSNYTQEELADIMSVSRQSISKWESDVAFPETEKLITLSKLYQCSIDYLLNEDSEEKAKSRGRSKYNTKKLPLIVTTMVFFIFTYFAYGFVWYGIPVRETVNGLINYNGIIYVNTYQLLFKSLGFDTWSGTFAAVLYFSFGFVAQGFAIAYLFVEWKGLRIFIWVSNILYLIVAALNLSMCFNDGFVGAAPGVLCGFSFILCILQFAVPAVRKTH